MNELTSSNYAHHIHTTYEQLKQLNQSSKPSILYLNEDLSLECDSILPPPSERGIKHIKNVLEKEQLDPRLLKQAKFIETVLQHILSGVDSDLELLSQLNAFRNDIRSVEKDQKKQWKHIAHSLVESYRSATEQTTPLLKQALMSNHDLLKTSQRLDALDSSDLLFDCPLPEETWIKIFSYVDFQSLKTLELVCKKFSRLAQEPWAVREVLQRQFHHLAPVYSLKDLKSHYVTRKNIQTNILKEISFDEELPRSCIKNISVSASCIVLGIPHLKKLYIYNPNDLTEKKVLNTPFERCQVYEDIIYLLYNAGTILQLNAKTLIPENKFRINTPSAIGFSLKNMSVSNEYIYLESNVSIGIVDRKKGEFLSEIPFDTEHSSHFAHKDWIIGHCNDGLIVEYPVSRYLEKSAGCVPHFIQERDLYCISTNDQTIKIFDLSTCKLKQTIKVCDILFTTHAAILQNSNIFQYPIHLAENNNILYIAFHNNIFMWNLLTNSHIKTITTETIVQKLVISDNLLLIESTEKVSYIDLSKSFAQDPISCLVRTCAFLGNAFISGF